MGSCEEGVHHDASQAPPPVGGNRHHSHHVNEVAVVEDDLALGDRSPVFEQRNLDDPLVAEGRRGRRILRVVLVDRRDQAGGFDANDLEPVGRRCLGSRFDTPGVEIPSPAQLVAQGLVADRLCFGLFAEERPAGAPTITCLACFNRRACYHPSITVNL